MRWSKQITSREIRLLSAIAALVIFAMATTAPSGGITCCGATEPDIKVTFNNEYEESSAFPYQPSIEYFIYGTDSTGKDSTVVVMQLVYGDSKTHTLPGGKLYDYMVYELEYGGFNNPIPTTGKCIARGIIIADEDITIK